MTQQLYVRHTVCPECRQNGKDRRGNNLAVYPDHVYCFACGYRRRTTTNLQARANNQRTSNSYVQLQGKGGSVYPLPGDFVLSLPVVGYEWIKQYGITDTEIQVNRIGWSDNGFTLGGRGSKENQIQYKPCMVFPIYDIYGNLLMWQARYFGSEKRYPKYVTRGKPQDILHILGKNNNGTITIVEDLLSAIKVSRYGDTLPLWGSNLEIKVATRISKLYDNLNIWLDHDKRKEAEKLRKRVDYLFKDKVQVICTTLDPKATSGEEIQTMFHRV